MFEYLVFSQWSCLGMIWRFGFVGENVSFGVCFEILEDPHHFQCSFLSLVLMLLRYDLSAIPSIMSLVCHHGL